MVVWRKGFVIDDADHEAEGLEPKEYQVILYYRQGHTAGMRLKKMVRRFFSEITLTTFHEPEAIRLFLAKGAIDEQVVLLAVDSEEELAELATLGLRQRGMKIILSLSDQKQQAVHAALALYPSFISFDESDLSRITAVLKQLQSKFNTL